MCCHGLFQDHLIHRLNQEFSVCAVVRHEYPNQSTLASKLVSKLSHPIKSIRHLHSRIKLREYESFAAQTIQAKFRSDGRIDNLSEIATTNVNNPTVIDFINHHSPDIVCVNGTNLIREFLLESIDIPFGVINLHTGLSPYSRGGNCNLFMLLENRPELVGITVHHIDKGIDSGDIIISSQASYNKDDNYEIIEANCFKLGIEAMVEACTRLFAGNADRVKQWEKGKLYLNRTGYQYQPLHRLQVNQLIQDGLIRDYLLDKHQIDKDVKTVGDFTINNV